jgi:transcriptional regulator with XRE-family HTH domain
MTKVTISNQQKETKKTILTLITEKGMNQSQIAKLTGRSPSVINEILKDGRSFGPGVINIISERLAKYVQKSELIQDLSQYQVIAGTLQKAIIGEKKRKKSTALFEHIIGGSGLGKSEVAKEFANKHKQFVYLVRLDRGMSYRELLEAVAFEMGLLKEAGKGSSRGVKRMQSSKLLDMITQKIETIVVDTSIGNYPVLIIDEAEEIPNATLRRVKNLYTAVEGMLSIVLVGINKNKGRHPAFNREYRTF